MRKLLPYIIALCYLAIGLVVVSIFDILLVFVYPRFYSVALFITTFAVGGVFAGAMAYMAGIGYALVKDEWTRWSLIILIIIIGCLFFFLLAQLEGGEYAAAFRAYGITMALSTFMFMKGKIE